MAEYCEYYAVCHYLPLRSETKVYQRRKVTVEKPMFPGYVFADVQGQWRDLVVRSSSLAKMIEVTDQDRFLCEIEQVRRALDIDPTLGATAAITSGKPVRIAGGPFQGLEGVVATVHGVTRVVLNVDMIGQAVKLDVEMGLLEPLND